MEQLLSVVLGKVSLHCLKENGIKINNVEEAVQVTALQIMERDAYDDGLKFTRAGLKNLLNRQEENKVAEQLNREDILRESAGLDHESAEL